MRILGGEFRGREITRPKLSSVRPMTQAERAALFNILGPVDGLSFLDAYAGSGAIGLEALSRGASGVVGIEANAAVCAVIRRNYTDLGLQEHYRLYAQTVEDWLKRRLAVKFDVMVAAPPFAKLDAAVLGQFSQHLSETGIIVVSHDSRREQPELSGVKMVTSRRYGDGTLSFYKP